MIYIKTKSIKNNLNYPLPYEFDLFGETSVTISEVELWVETLTVFNRNSPRFDWYVKNWDVVNKIKAAKNKHLTLEVFLEHYALVNRR